MHLFLQLESLETLGNVVCLQCIIVLSPLGFGCHHFLVTSDSLQQSEKGG